MKVMSVVTDSTPVEDPKDPETCNIFNIFRLFAPPDETEALRQRYVKGGAAYGEVKKRTAELINAHFADARERYAELSAKPEAVRQVLADGAARARAVARVTLQRAREACGML
jgi:tryptophanyl-tRNA synthetase